MWTGTGRTWTDAALLIDTDGRIAHAGPRDAVDVPGDAVFHDYADGIVMPGLVNTHTHLELHAFAGAVDEREFHEWILRVRDRKDATSHEAFLAAAEAGVKSIIQPGGSMRDDEVIAAANEHGIAMVFTGARHFRH